MFRLEKIKQKDVKRVCMVPTVYSLLQYLLISSEDEIKHTYFFLTTTFGERTLSFFPNKHVIYPGQAHVLLRGPRLLYKMFLMWTRNLFWPFFRHAEVFALDHAFYVFLRKKTYIQLDDGMGTYCHNPMQTDRSARLLGFSSDKQWGRSKYCKGRFLSMEPPKDSYLREKPYKKFDLQTLWKEASAEKKQFIMEIFDVKQEDLDFFAPFENILLTQCYSEDKTISEEEKIACYRRIVEAYHLEPGKTLIKTHPRELTDYEKLFPGFAVFTKKIPIELVVLNVSNAKKAITLTSTSVFLFNRDKTEIIWCGCKFSPELQRIFGEVECPF